MRRWKERNEKSKRAIVCSFGAEPIARFGYFYLIHDGTAEEIWKEINCVFITSSRQVIINLSQEQACLQFNDIDDWTKYLNWFHKLLTQLASYGLAVGDDDKASKLMRTLPNSFEPL